MAAHVGMWMILMVAMVGMAAAYPSYLVNTYQQCYVNVRPHFNFVVNRVLQKRMSRSRAVEITSSSMPLYSPADGESWSLFPSGLLAGRPNRSLSAGAQLSLTFARRRRPTRAAPTNVCSPFVVPRPMSLPSAFSARGAGGAEQRPENVDRCCGGYTHVRPGADGHELQSRCRCFARSPTSSRPSPYFFNIV